MPDEIKLTQEEKNILIQKRKDYILEFNQYLPDEKKLVFDEEEFNEYLDKESTVKYYKSLTELSNRLTRQKEIYQKLINDNGDIPADKLLLARSFASGLKTENTAEANEYNEKLYHEYLTDPDKLFYKRYKEVLEFNPEELLKVIDDKQKLVDFYLKNQAVCDDAFVFESQMSNTFAQINPNLRNSISGMKKLIESLKYPGKVATAEMFDCVAFPELTQEQASMIVAGNAQKYMGLGTPISQKFNQILYPLNPNDIKDDFKLIKDKGYILGKGFFYRYVAEEYNPAKNETKEISFDDGLRKAKTNSNITYRERSVEEIRELAKINKAYNREFVDIWQHKFSLKYNNKPFVYNEIRHDNKGGYFERFFRTTSKEYTRFINALEEFNDYTSPNFGNKKYLKDCAIAYQNHKNAQGLSINNIDNTGRGRLILVNAVLEAFDEMDEEYVKINDEINNRIFDIKAPKKETFLEEREVDDDLINTNSNNNNIIEIESDLNKDNDLDL